MESVTEQGHLSMNLNPTSLSLFKSTLTNSYFALRLRLTNQNTQPNGYFLTEFDDQTFVLPSFLSTDAKYIGISQDDRFLLAMSDSQMALFQLECTNRAMEAVDYTSGMCVRCSTCDRLFDPSKKNACENDPSAKFFQVDYSLDVLTDQTVSGPVYGFTINVQNYNLPTFEWISGIFTANPLMILDKMTLTASNPPTHAIIDKTFTTN